MSEVWPNIGVSRDDLTQIAAIYLATVSFVTNGIFIMHSDRKINQLTLIVYWACLRAIVSVQFEVMTRYEEYGLLRCNIV